MRRNRLIAGIFVALALVGLACESEGPATPGQPPVNPRPEGDYERNSQPRRDPNPNAADPEPHPTEGKGKRVNWTCSWDGERFFKIDLTVNGKRQPGFPRERKGVPRGQGRRKSGLHETGTIFVEDSAIVLLICEPGKGQREGQAMCLLEVPDAKLEGDFKTVPSGAVSCRARLYA